ncbi:MAG: GNAT family N-acetyltransferase [Defluviitaleaceae bacterium]|nr:GNAT family N-acetyltransferase [Defluviitaleaceae bacterium]
MSNLILIAGLPATGKTSFAKFLSEELSIPMVSKDIVKELLYDTLGFKSRAEKVALNMAAIEIMHHFAEAQLSIGQSIILERNFESVCKPKLLALIEKFKPCTITVTFHANIETLFPRFIERDRSSARHRGHVVNMQYPETDAAPTMSIEDQGLTPAQFLASAEERGMLNFSVGGEEIFVDTSDFSQVSYETIAEAVKSKLIEFIKLDMQSEAMMMALFPLYQSYESEISKEELEDIFPTDAFEENFEYFKAYFEGKPTYICVMGGEYRGFVSFHLDSEETPGYADEYTGWGHLSDIYVDKKSRGLGLGKVMANKAEEGLKKLNISGIYLTDIADNGLFWKFLGYADTGKIEPNEGGRIYEKHV